MPTPKILLFDVETSPNIAYIWGKYEQDAIKFLVERQIICFSWKWLGERKVNCRSLPMYPEYKKSQNTNKSLVLELSKILNKADIVVGHNVDEFDHKMTNTDLIKNGYKPTRLYRTIDTLKIAKKHFRFNSNKLNDLAMLLGVGSKVDTGGFSLWEGCLRGNKKSWSKMEKYNKRDVLILERVYLKLRPFSTTHPNSNALDGRSGCPNCKSIHVSRKGYRINLKGKLSQFQCQDCGRWFTQQMAYVRGL